LISRYKSIALVLPLIATFGCSRRQTADNRQLEFRNKLACAQLRPEIEKNAEQSDHEIDGIYSIFYSPKLNTCVVAKVIVWDATQPYVSSTVEITDALDQRIIWAQYSKKQPINMTDLDKILDQHIDELKRN
jgi:hypothetical protein